MLTQKLLIVIGSLLAASLLSTAAKADIVLPGRCHMGICSESRLTKKETLRSGPNGTLYSVELAHRSWPMEAEPTEPFREPSISYVYCSTQRPAYLFKVDDIYYAHLLNPGGHDFFGYNMSDYPIYWATCHNFVGPNFFSEQMTANAIRLGYPLNLPQEQIELRNVLEIMN